MKIIKLYKKDFYSLESLLAHAEARKDRNAYPSHVYVSPKTYKKLTKCIKDMFKYECYLRGNQLKASVAMYMLNLAPNVLKGLPDDVMLVDESSIKKEMDNVILLGGSND